MTDPGAPHILENFLAELTWTGAFLISLGFGVYQVFSARVYDAARIRLRANGAAELESRLLARRAWIRVVVSICGVVVGVWQGLLTPDIPVANQFALGAFMVFAIGYASPAVIEVIYARRQLRILRAGKHNRKEDSDG